MSPGTLQLVPSLPAEASDWLHGADDDILACRASQHTWPKLRPGPLPRGINAVPQPDRCVQIKETCFDCGLVRHKTTLPGGAFDREAVYVYDRPPGFATPPSSGILKADIKEELWRRLDESNTLLDAVNAAKQLARREAAKTSSPKRKRA